ncbi:peroxisomal membrane protein 13 isoform X1, partial [Tanacetum coccineum]
NEVGEGPRMNIKTEVETNSRIPFAHSKALLQDEIYKGYLLVSGPPSKLWERAGSSSGPAPFKPASAGSISDVVESSGTARPGETFPQIIQL